MPYRLKKRYAGQRRPSNENQEDVSHQFTIKFTEEHIKYAVRKFFVRLVAGFNRGHMANVQGALDFSTRMAFDVRQGWLFDSAFRANE